MSDDQMNFEMSVPLDKDGFLRRECPTCEREFKCLPDTESTDTHVPDGGYFCPYCGVQSPVGTWHTKSQVALAVSIAARAIIPSIAEELGGEIDQLNRASGGLLSGSVSSEVPAEHEPLTEDDGMNRVDFTCHPGDPLKVLEDWQRPARCSVCGRPTD